MNDVNTNTNTPSWRPSPDSAAMACCALWLLGHRSTRGAGPNRDDQFLIDRFVRRYHAQQPIDRDQRYAGYHRVRKYHRQLRRSKYWDLIKNPTVQNQSSMRAMVNKQQQINQANRDLEAVLQEADQYGQW